MNSRIYFVIGILLFLSTVSCTNNDHNPIEPKTVKSSEKTEVNNEIELSEFQTILDSVNVKGSILIYDFSKDQYFSNDIELANTGHLPASTFKIPNSIIALETGIVENDSSIFKWDGEKRRMKLWEQDLTFRNAFHFSCVPCYQEIARKVGVERMVQFTKDFDYGQMEIDSNNLDLFWLTGASRISPFAQIDFLSRFYQKQLPISLRTDSIMRNMMVIFENDSIKLSGKTGWSTDNNIDNGWFVGYIETKAHTYYFATNLDRLDSCKESDFVRIRKEVTYKAFSEIGIHIPQF